MNNLKNNSKLNFFLFLIQFLFRIIPVTSDCSNGKSITDNDCFNDLILIQKNYRGPQFTTNKEGIMLIEYSNSQYNADEYRLFYGLKKNGRNYFENDNAHKILKIETDLSPKSRYEAKNSLLYLEEDTDREKPYLS